MSFQTDYPTLATAVHDLCDAAGNIKLGLQDGHLSIDEVVDAIPDEQAKADVKRLLTALQEIPREFADLMAHPWTLMTEFAPYLMSEATAVFK